MKNIICIAFCAALLCACNHPVKYPELDKSEAAKLVPLSDYSGVYATSAKITAKGKEIIHQATVCVETRQYYVYASYPVTVCFPSGYKVPTEVAIRKKDDSISAIINSPDTPTHEVHLKKLTEPLYCKTVSGPWICQVTDQEVCGGGHEFTMTITGVPEPVTFTWTGAWSDMPLVVQIFNPTGGNGVFNETDTYSSCDASNPTNCNGTGGQAGSTGSPHIE